MDYCHDRHIGNLHGGSRLLDCQCCLPHMAGSMGASPDESTWVITSYLVATAIVLPMSGWLSNVIGRKRFYMASSLSLPSVHSHVRPCNEPSHVDLLPHPPGRRRRRAWSDRAGDSRRHVFSQTTGHGIRYVWHGDRRSSGDWADAGRMDHRQLQLALDLLHQCSHRNPLARTHTARRSGPRLSQEPQAFNQTRGLPRDGVNRRWRWASTVRSRQGRTE